MPAYRLPQLFEICANPIRLINFLLINGLIKCGRKCSRRNCRRRMIIVRKRSISDGHHFRCPKCKSYQSIRKGSFFENSNLSIPQILYVTFCWATKASVKSTVYLADVCQHSVSQWYQFLREKCSESLLTNPNCIFGGEGVIVQVDESVVARRKYNIGRAVDQQWVFGIYDTRTKLGHVQLVDNRRADTLIPIIQKYVIAGTTIYSDQWAAYAQLGNLGYTHMTVDHSRNFVDPNTGVCTNSIQAYWSRVKRNVRLHWLSRRDQLPLRIDEFLWRDMLQNKTDYAHVFHEMLRLMAAK